MSRTYSSWITENVYIFINFSHLPLPYFLALVLLSVSISMIIFYVSISEGMKYWSFCVWFILLSIMSSKFINVTTNGKILRLNKISFSMSILNSICVLSMSQPLLLHQSQGYPHSSSPSLMDLSLGQISVYRLLTKTFLICPSSLCHENFTESLEKETATHSSIHAWEIPWTKEPGGLQSMGSQRVGHDWATSVCSVCAQYNEQFSFIKY